MEAIILAGGLGTRLRSVVSDVPKPLAPVAGRPFLQWLLDYMQPYGFGHIVLSTGYMHEKIAEHFGDNYRGMRLSYAVEDKPLGTGGGIRNALNHCEDDEMVVVNGDTFFAIDYSLLEAFFHRQPTRLAVVLRQVADTGRYGRVTLDCCDRISAFAEKDGSHGPGNINGGIYMLHRSLLEEYSGEGAFSFEHDIIAPRVAQEPVYAYVATDFFIDIGIPEDYRRLDRLWSEK